MASSEDQEKPPPPIWQARSYSAFLADSFVSGTELDGAGRLSEASSILAYLLSRVLRDADAARRALPLLDDSELGEVAKAVALLQALQEVAATEMMEPDKELVPFLLAWQQRVAALPAGATLLVPGGWVGTTQDSAVVHVLERR